MKRTRGDPNQGERGMGKPKGSLSRTEPRIQGGQLDQNNRSSVN